MRSTLLALLPALGLLAGCAKTSDVGHLEEEATGVAVRYKARLDDLSRRLDRLVVRDGQIGKDVTGHPLEAERLVNARTMLEQLRNQVTTAPTAIANASKTGQVELIKLTDDMDQRLHDGFTRVNAEIDALDSWISIAESQPHTAAMPAMPAVPDTAAHAN